METNEKKMSAAYALNLCTVSVSQIVDYDDLNVMEQEYDAILNNLNLENMPHDEALLNILKQILDTITFFRIQEGDRRIIDMKYRQKMRDAIWSAVPNFGLVLATANPIPMLISLASQVGIGYMNYRKTKSENNLDYEEQKWKLQRTAMEQLNGLQRELLDTAWRLADTYGFEDELRLSEKQIKHYDSILMDDNALRKYDRLDSIKENFTAYPPFWYYLGNTANEIYRDISLPISDEARQYYRNRAEEHFEQFWISNKYPLLREDQLASSCALEYVDLLIEDGADRHRIMDLLDKAVKYAGNSWDVLQLCAIGYLRIDAKEKAIPALRILVNEKYNSSVNAQLLSGIYISEYSQNGNKAAKTMYEALACRVNNKAHMIPWPTDESDYEEEFYNNQREMLARRYRQMINSFKDKYTALFNGIIPIPQDEMERTGADYSESCRQERIDAVEHIMSSPKGKEEFRDDINDISFGVEYIRLINSMFSSLSTLSVISNMDELVMLTEKLIKGKSKKLESIQKEIVNYQFTLDDYKALQEITSEEFLEDVFEELKKQINDSIKKMDDMMKLSTGSSEIVEFCHEENIALPDSKEEKLQEVVEGAGKQTFLTARILGEKAEYTSRVMEKKGIMTGAIKKKVAKAITGNINMLLLYPGEEGFNYYFSKCSKQVKGYKNEALAILDDKAFLFDTDLVFIQNGILIIERNSLKEICPYDAVEYDGKKLMLGSTNYSNNTVDLGQLFNALVELKQISAKR